MATNMIDSLTSILINLLYTLLTTALASFFLQKLITYLTLPCLFKTRAITREYEKRIRPAQLDIVKISLFTLACKNPKLEN